VEQNEDAAEVARRLGVQRVNIDRIRFALPSEKMSATDFSLITALCVGGGGGDKWGTHLPDDTEIEVEIRTDPGESG
jgi:hypothetical protein